MHKDQTDTTRFRAAASAAFARMTANIGDPVALAVLDGVALRNVRAWVAALVTFVRKLVLLEAIALTGRAEPSALLCRRRSRAQPKGSSAERKAVLRLWPSAPRTPARIRMLGAATSMQEIWRARRRDALCRQLAAARANRSPPALQLTRRIDALARIVADPLAAARRLARQLTRAPRLALTLAAKRPPKGAAVALELSDELCSCAFAAALALNNSS